MLLKEGLEALLNAFDEEEGANQGCYIGTRDMLHFFLGTLAANDFVQWINATDGQFYWREGTSSGTFIAKWQKELDGLDSRYPLIVVSTQRT